jgi:hypothetical protein
MTENSKTMQRINYLYNLLEDELMKSKNLEEINTINDRIAHHQSTNTTRSCTAKTAPVNEMIKMNLKKGGFEDVDWIYVT